MLPALRADAGWCGEEGGVLLVGVATLGVLPLEQNERALPAGEMVGDKASFQAKGSRRPAGPAAPEEDREASASCMFAAGLAVRARRSEP